MNNITDILNTCEEIMDTGAVQPEDINELADVSYNMFLHIKEFVEAHPDCCSEYAIDYLTLDAMAKKDALNAFANILEEIEVYINS